MAINDGHKQIERAAWEVAIEARKIWNESAPVPENHWYISQKGLSVSFSSSFSLIWSQLRVYTKNNPQQIGHDHPPLLIPIFSANGVIQNLQLIHENGRQEYIKNGKINGEHLWLQFPKTDIDKILICITFATGASLNEATGLSVCVVFEEHNLVEVAKIVRMQYPNAPILICSDKDDMNGFKYTMVKEYAKLVGGIAVFPGYFKNFNDLHIISGSETVRSYIFDAIKKPELPWLPTIGLKELESAKAIPDCLVENYLYADLGLVETVEGTDQSTILIYEAVHIAMGRDLWGLKVLKPGSTLFVLAEDAREFFVARLRDVLNALKLSVDEKKKAIKRILILDFSHDITRLADIDPSGNIKVAPLADMIAENCKNDPPAQIVFDPAISFGPRDGRVAEQAIATAARRIVRALGCCVRLVYHSERASPHNDAVDSRPSKSWNRMSTVLRGVGDDGSRFVLARPKLPHGAPQPNIWIWRQGFAFGHGAETEPSKSDITDDEKVLRFIREELAKGEKHSANGIGKQSETIQLSRTRVRDAIGRLIAKRRVVHAELPKNEIHGARKTYLAIPPEWTDE